MKFKLDDFFNRMNSLEFVKSGHVTGDDIKIATAVLLLEMAGADKNYDESETNLIFDALKEEFGLDDSQSYEFLEVANVLRKDKRKIKEFAGLLNKQFDEEQRKKVLSLAWTIAIADSAIHVDEEVFCQRLGSLLNLSKEAVTAARDEGEKAK